MTFSADGAFTPLNASVVVPSATSDIVCTSLPLSTGIVRRLFSTALAVGAPLVVVAVVAWAALLLVICGTSPCKDPPNVIVNVGALPVTAILLPAKAGIVCKLA